MQYWYLSDWKLERLPLFKYIQEIRKTELGYYLKLNFEMGYRRFLIHDNGGEVNIEEIGASNPHFSRSLLLPINGRANQTNEAVLWYRLIQFINNEPIDWFYAAESPSDEEYAVMLTYRQRAQVSHPSNPFIARSHSQPPAGDYAPTKEKPYATLS